MKTAKGPGIAKTPSKENKIGRITLLDLNIYYKTLVIKTMWHHCKERQMLHANEDPEIYTWTTDFLQRYKGNPAEKKYSFQQMVLKELGTHYATYKNWFKMCLRTKRKTWNYKTLK